MYDIGVFKWQFIVYLNHSIAVLKLFKKYNLLDQVILAPFWQILKIYSFQCKDRLALHQRKSGLVLSFIMIIYDWPYHRPHILENSHPPQVVWVHWPFYHWLHILRQTKHHWSKSSNEVQTEDIQLHTFAVVIFCFIRSQFLDLSPAMMFWFISIFLFFSIISSLKNVWYKITT